MQYGLLVYPHNSQNIFNIGDYIQSIAARQFLPEINVFVNREQLTDPIDRDIKIILNGWFMHNPNNWPPNDRINPLFVAFHMNKLAEKEMLSKSGIEYLKKNEPIGCRDYYTVDLLKSKGINAYFSGCLTLTLGLSYHHVNIEKAPIYITDLNPQSHIDFAFKFKSLITLILKHKFIKKIQQRMLDCGFKKRLTNVIAIYETYRNVIDDEVFVKAIYREHEIEDKFSSDEDKFKYAESLLMDYSKARYVVTSRIHCALPCLGIGTPVVFVTDAFLGEVHNCRLEGLKQLFYTINLCKEGVLMNVPGTSKLKYNSDFNNKLDYLSFANRLITSCRNFIVK